MDVPLDIEEYFQMVASLVQVSKRTSNGDEEVAWSPG